MDRRTLIASGALTALFCSARAASRSASPFDPQALQADLEAYDAYGPHRAGGPGDRQTAAWIGERLQEAGFAVETQTFETPYTENRLAEIVRGDARLSLQWQHPGGGGRAAETAGPLRHVRPDDMTAVEPGDLVLLETPKGRWSSLGQPLIARALNALGERGAAGVVLWTRTPSGDPVALNATEKDDAYAFPLAVCGDAAGRVLGDWARDGAQARLIVSEDRSLREARNVIGRRPGTDEKAIVVTTPVSAWFHAAGERGPGVAIFLALAKALPAAAPDASLIFAAFSGHEYANLGGRIFSGTLAPPPEATRLWCHLGAGLAARSWHEIGGRRLAPLSHAEDQRFLLASPDLLDAARAAFAGEAGLADPYPLTPETAAGELTHIARAGYPRAVGAFSAHAYHHSANDRLQTTSGELVAPVARAFFDIIQAGSQELPTRRAD